MAHCTAARIAVGKQCQPTGTHDSRNPKRRTALVGYGPGLPARVEIATTEEPLDSLDHVARHGARQELSDHGAPLGHDHPLRGFDTLARLAGAPGIKFQSRFLLRLIVHLRAASP